MSASAFPLVPFSSAMRDCTGGNIKVQRKAYTSDGELPVVDQGQDFIAGYTQVANQYKGALPLVLFGDHTRIFKYVDFPFALGADGVKALEPQEGFDAKFLFYYFRSVHLPSAGYSRHFKFLKEVLVPKPSLPEQRRIVDLLSRAEGIVRLRREAEKKAAELIPALFLDMFGDPATNPKGWPTASIGDLFEVKGGKRLPKGAPYAEEPTAFRYIRGTDIWPDQINTQNLVYLRPEDQATIKRYVVAKGDVVITIAGKIGVTAPVGDDLVGVNLTENAAMIRPHETESTNAAFLSSMLNSRFVQRQIETLTGRVTIGKLALERIRFLKILLPALSLQAEYVQRIEQIRAIQSQQSTATAKAQAAFDALLAQAFTPAQFNCVPI